MRIFLTILGGAVALFLAVISIGANATFGSFLTTGLERWLYAVLFGSLDILKTLLPLIAAAAFVAGARTKGVVALATFAVLTILSLTASIGLYATTKSETVGDAKAARARYADAVAARDTAEADLAALGTVRPAGEIAGELAAAKHDRLYDRSKQCTDATATDSRALCADIGRLEGEAAKAAEAKRLSRALDAARVKVDSLDVGAAMKAIDPQAEQLAKLASAVTPTTPETVRTILAVLIAFLVEIGAGLGPWLVAPVASARKSESAGPSASAPVPIAAKQEPEPMTVPAPAGDAGEDLVGRWAGTALVRRRGAYVRAAEARTAFETWCASDGAEPLNPTAFGKAMRALGYDGRKVGGAMRYEGVALTATRAGPLRLAVDNALPDRRALGKMATVGVARC